MKPPSVETIAVETKKAVPSNFEALAVRAMGKFTRIECGATVAPRRTKTGSPGRAMMVEGGGQGAAGPGLGSASRPPRTERTMERALDAEIDEPRRERRSRPRR